MIPAHLNSALANHLWQSTLVAAAAGLLTLLLRSNQARARYWLWLIASVKFLVPFALLVAVGSHSGWPNVALARSHGLSIAMSVAMEQISQPFTAPVGSPVIRHVGLPTTDSALSAILLAIWACGFLAVALSWCVRWRRIQATVRAGSPLAIEADVPVLSTPSLIEPGVFGIMRPVLLLPEGITDHLAPEHLAAILAHEACHLRRRDNLAAAIHMFVEALFWFHPLVWWIGTRLVEERERACDEEVLRQGSEPHLYAESILKTCQFYLESPLACMSGISGADLKKRVVRIMTERIANKLDLRRKLLLMAAGFAAIAGPIVFGVVNAPAGRAQSQPAASPRPSFEVASIKPNKGNGMGRFIQIRDRGGRFSATNMPTEALIEFAYGVKPFQISGAPKWLNSDRYDIEAKPESSASDKPERLTEEQRKTEQERLKLMVQSLLADRFKLAIHTETKELPVYVLVVAKNGPKLQESKEGSSLPDPKLTEPKPGEPRDKAFRAAGPKGAGMMMGRGTINGRMAPLQLLADALSRQLDRTVLDRTGLNGKYDISLHWTPDESQSQMFKGPGGGEGGPGPNEGAPSPDASGPSIFTAIQEQVGLKLESQKGPVEIIVIDHVEKATEN
jgi:bla regulator protein blaR1